MPLRTARGHECVQDATGALGQGTDADGEKDSAARDEVGPARGSESRSGFSSHRKRQLSLHGDSLDAAAARHDRAFLSGLVPDAVYRLAAIYRFEHVHFGLLSGCPARALSPHVETFDRVHAV